MQYGLVIQGPRGLVGPERLCRRGRLATLPGAELIRVGPGRRGRVFNSFVAYVKRKSVGKFYTLLKSGLQKILNSLKNRWFALLARRLYKGIRSLKHGRPGWVAV